MLAARRVGISARAPRGPRQLTPKLPHYIKSLLHLPPRPPARLRLFLAPRPDLQSLYVVPSRFFSKLRDPKALSANARARDNLRPLQRTPDDADPVFQDTQAKDGATLTEVLEYALGEAPKAFNAAMAATSKEEQHAAVLRAWDAMPDGHYKATPWEYTSALVAAVHLRQKKRLFEILDEVKTNEVEADNLHGRVVRAACRTKQHGLVCEILDYMHASGVDTTGLYVSAQRLAFKSGEYDFVLQLLRLMKTHGMDPTEQYKHHLISLHKAGLHDRVQSVFEAMRKAGCVCDENMYGAAVDSAIRVKNRDLVMSILDDMKQDADLPKTPTVVFPRAVEAAELTNENQFNEVKDYNLYRRVVGAACQTKQHELVCEILDYMHANGVDCTSAYVSAIRVAFKSGEYDFALELLRLMQKHGMDPTEQYKHQIRSLHKAGLHVRVQSVFEAMRKAGGVCDDDMYKTAVNSAIRVKNRDLVMSILDDMKRNVCLSKTRAALFRYAVGTAVLANQQQLLFDVFDSMDRTDFDASAAYVTAIRTAFKSKQYDFVFDILRKMTENGVDASEEYSHAVMLFSKLECYDQVLRAFKAMRELGYTPTEQYKHQIRSLHKAGLHDRVQSVFEAMRKAGGVCDDDMYKTAVNSAIRVKNRDLVMSILDDMKRNVCLSKTRAALFRYAVGTAVLANQQQLLFDVFDSMDRTDIDASAAYVTAIRTAFKSKQYDFVFDILRKMTENGVDASEEYSHAVMLFSKLECYDQVLRAFKAMRELGYTPTEQYKHQIRSLHKAGLHDRLLSVFEAMRKAGCVCDEDVYGSAVDSAIRVKNHDLVMSILDDMKQDADLPKTPTVVFPRAVEAAELTNENQFNEVKDDNMYRRVVGAACQTKQHELVCEILDYMHANGVDCTSAYVSACRVAFKSGEYDFALELLRLMKTHGMDPTEQYKHHLMSLHKAGLHDRVLSVFEAMRKEGCVRDEDMYETAVDSAIRVKNRDLVMSILDDMKRDADLSKIPTAVFRRAVGAAVWTNQHQLVLDVFDFMHHTDTDASAAYVTAIRTAFKSTQYDFVFDILRKMTENGVDASEEYSHAVMSFSKLECYDQVLRAFKAMRELGYGQEKVLCTNALRAATKLDRYDDVIAICNGLNGKPSVTTPLHSHALEQAHSTNKQALVDSILESIKKSTTGAE